jgi:hypothetical protein
MRTFVGLLAFAFTTTAFANGIKNSDSREYRIVFKTDKDEVSKLINTSTNYEKHSCTQYPCTLENKDTGEKVKLTTGDEKVEISGGKFTVKL